MRLVLPKLNYIILNYVVPTSTPFTTDQITTVIYLSITCHTSRNSTQILLSAEHLPTSSLLRAFRRPPATIPVTLEVLNSIDQEDIHKLLLNTALNVCSVLREGKTTTTLVRCSHSKSMLPVPPKPALTVLSNPMTSVGLTTTTPSAV